MRKKKPEGPRKKFVSLTLWSSPSRNSLSTISSDCFSIEIHDLVPAKCWEQKREKLGNGMYFPRVDCVGVETMKEQEGMGRRQIARREGDLNLVREAYMNNF